MKVHITAVIEFFQKTDETDDEMLNVAKMAIENNIGKVIDISKIKTPEADQTSDYGRHPCGCGR